MKLLPTGRQNFEDVIKENLLYVDKTRQVFELLRQGRLYFLSRPRRFGKSLLVSLFRHLFLGNRDVFKDLYIGLHTDYDFVEYPVLQFNFADFGLKTKNLEEELELVIQGYAAEFGVDIETSSIATQFRTLIQNISRSRGKPVALLIDEYDKPIIDFLTEVDKAEANQQILRQLFGPLKGLEAAGHLRFLFITGVSKFSKVSLFSDLNNLTDLSIHSLSHDLLGITQAELTYYFGEYMDQAASKYELT
ncbi:MAG TPA: AAA family ATPase, partial [Saprospiraceae bacterium]|nr:AAA family ATPase [Saprospiraceae bacterium]